MSHVLRLGDMRVDYWRYLSEEVISFLDIICRKKSMEKGEIPDDIFNQVKEFFQSALQARDMKDAKDPTACISNYRIVADALRKRDRSFESDRKKLENGMIEMASLFESLKTKEIQCLNADESEKIQKLREFFNCIYRFSDMRVYEETIGRR